MFVLSCDSASDVKQALDGVRQRRGGTKTHFAIDLMRNDMFLRTPRPGVLRVGIIVTDGGTEDAGLTRWAAKAAQADGIKLYVVGIGMNVNR